MSIKPIVYTTSNAVGGALRAVYELANGEVHLRRRNLERFQEDVWAMNALGIPVAWVAAWVTCAITGSPQCGLAASLVAGWLPVHLNALHLSGEHDKLVRTGQRKPIPAGSAPLVLGGPE